jgi:predicted chitinase
MADLTPDQIAAACRCHPDSVAANWPLVLAALDRQGIAQPLVQVAAAATIAVETARTFRPINEMGGPAYFTRLYEHRLDLGNVIAGDGARYHGRGFVQITGRANYRTFGQQIGVDLEGQPELACTPGPAADVLALFFWSRHVADAALARDWTAARRRVNGGANGLQDFLACVTALLGAAGLEAEVAHA